MVARVRGEAVQRGARQIGVLRCEKQAERGRGSRAESSSENHKAAATTTTTTSGVR
jgi:hypothetical protein